MTSKQNHQHIRSGAANTDMRRLATVMCSEK